MNHCLSKVGATTSILDKFLCVFVIFVSNDFLGFSGYILGQMQKHKDILFR